jgi:hypothetical protein
VADRDHHDHHIDPEDEPVPRTDTTPDTSATTSFPRVPRFARRSDGVARAAGDTGDATRLDPYGMYDVPEPTRVTPAPPVSPIGVHTRGAAATTPPGGIPYPATADTPAVQTLNALLDDRDRIAADTRTAWAGRRLFRTDRRKVRTVREEAARRAAAKLRHERTMEHLETARAIVLFAILVALFIIVVGAGYIGFGILVGWYEWSPTRVR